ncbi:glycoside hydrolase family 18 protein [Cysteiniphilum sp. QT6929]|uniref:glycoside hydrolase family 18 protein n=1 Tax=Cysteiniphilum sp. QT6929 TaxID=2975055 RepID=UPI0024B3B2D4|nr:glycoside hydrolase family 18 protein [Cysteiniphilum sp. QT6929]WHN66646.1 glycoside hydrolase family 18 protein [Cysteiniphilum sp. QT6929]
MKNINTDKSMGKFKKGLLPSLLLGSLLTLSACGGGGGGGDTPAPTPGPTPATKLGVQISIPNATSGSIEEGKISGTGIDVVINKQALKRVAGIGAANGGFALVLKEDLNPRDGETASQMGTSNILAGAIDQGNKTYLINVMTDTNGYVHIPFDASKIKSSGNISGIHHFEVVSIDGKQDFEVTEDNIPHGLNIKVPVKFFLRDMNNNTIDTNQEIASGSQLQLCAEITRDYNEGVTVFYAQNDMNQNLRQGLKLNDDPFSVTIAAGDDDQTACKTYTVDNKVDKGQESLAQAKSYQYLADDTKNTSIQAQYDTAQPIITVDTDDYINWLNANSWPSDAQFDDKGQFQLADINVHFGHMKSGNEFVNAQDDDVKASCEAFVDGQLDPNVSCSLNNGVLAFTATGDSIFKTHTINLTFTQQGTNVTRSYNNLTIIGANEPGQNIIQWSEQSAGFGNAKGKDQEKDNYPVAGVFSPTAVVVHEDGSTSDQVDYSCEVYDDQTNTVVTGSDCRLEVNTRDIFASVPEYKYTNKDGKISMPSFSVKITAHDASTTDPKLQAHDLTTKNQHLPFPVIDEHDVSLDFIVTDNDNDPHIAKSIKQVKFPQVFNRASGLKAESFAENNGKQIQLTQLKDSSTWQIQDDNAPLNDQVYTVTKLGEAFPDFNWYEHVTVYPTSYAYIDVSDYEGFRNEVFFDFWDETKLNGQTWGFNGPLDLSKVPAVNVPQEDQAILKTGITCAVVDNNGNKLDGECGWFDGMGQYELYVTNLNPSQTGRKIQVYLQDHDKLIAPTAVFPNGKGIEIPDTTPPKSKPKLIGYVTNYGVYGNNSCVGGVGGPGHAIPYTSYPIPRKDAFPATGAPIYQATSDTTCSQVDDGSKQTVALQNTDMADKVKQLTGVAYAFLFVYDGSVGLPEDAPLGAIHFSDPWSDLKRDKLEEGGNNDWCNASNMNFRICTADPSAIWSKDKKFDLEWYMNFGNFDAFANLDQYNKDLDKIVSIGGWDAINWGVYYTLGSNKHIDNLVDSVQALADRFNITEVDLDVENDGKTRDFFGFLRNKLAAVIKALHTGVKIKSGAALKVSLTIQADPAIINALKDSVLSKENIENLESLNLMTYDFTVAQSSGGKTGFNQALFQPEGDAPNEFTIDLAVQAAKAAMPGNEQKINMGLAAYSRAINGPSTLANNHGFGNTYTADDSFVLAGDLDSASCSTSLKDGNRCASSFNNRYLLQFAKPEETYDFTVEKDGKTYHVGSTAVINGLKAPQPTGLFDITPATISSYWQDIYANKLAKNTSVFFYTSGADAKDYGRYAQEQGIGGAIMWTIDGDVPVTDTKNSLITNFINGFTGNN